MEMSGYVAPGNEKQITILEDYVNKPLTNFLKVRAKSDLANNFFDTLNAFDTFLIRWLYRSKILCGISNDYA